MVALQSMKLYLSILNSTDGSTLSQPKKISSEELEVELAERSVPIVIDFYAAWCIPILSVANLRHEICWQESTYSSHIIYMRLNKNPSVAAVLCGRYLVYGQTD